MAIRGAVEAMAGRKRHIITTRVEHPAVLGVSATWKSRATRSPSSAWMAAGSLDLDQLTQAITPDTALVSIMWANNETGVIFPIEEIAQIVKARGAVFHTDAVQAAGKLPIDLSRVPIDLLSISGHKLHAPKGIGALYVRKGTKLMPLIMGGHQEKGSRAGTENVPFIVGLGQACELALSDHEEESRRQPAARQARGGHPRRCTDTRVNGDRNRLPNTLNISFEFIEGEAILLMLDDLGICGLLRLGLHLRLARTLARDARHGRALHGGPRLDPLQPQPLQHREDVDYVVEHMPAIIDRLRELSPFAGGMEWHGTPLEH